MEIYFPTLLSRKKAMLISGFTRKKLEKLAQCGLIRVFLTKGNHKRYYRDDLIKIFNEKL
jgi:hypothetical protein